MVSRAWLSLNAPVAPMRSAAGMSNDHYGDLLRGIVLQWASDYRVGQRAKFARENSLERPWPVREETREFAESPEFWELCAAVNVDAEWLAEMLNKEEQ
jgi:hypothetical protein